MDVTIFALAVVVIVWLLWYAERSKEHRVVGIISSFLLVGLGVWLYQSGIQYTVGETVVMAGSSNLTGNITAQNMVLNSTITRSEVAIPYTDFKMASGLVASGLGLFGIVFYGMRIADGR